MKKIKIGLLGGLVNSSNLGCCALTYGAISILETISRKLNYEFSYVIFEWKPNEVKLSELRTLLSIPKERLSGVYSGKFLRFYKIKENAVCKRKMKECDLFLSITQGDSFSDIYGIKHFLSCWSEQFTVLQENIPLILAPQTYGPYNSKLAQICAKYIIENANAVFTRDTLSANYLASLGIDREINTVTDLAFALDYTPQKFGYSQSNQLNVGVNVSGLLWPDKTEATPANFGLECDYEILVCNTIKILLEKEHNVYLISHVEEDYEVCKKIAEKYPGVVCTDKFKNPIEAKSFIAGLDLFIGARMHATIAAFSAGVPVVPVAYSRKFKGLFNDLSYPVCIDLKEMDSDTACAQMMTYIKDIDSLKVNITKSRTVLSLKYEKLLKNLENAIANIVLE